MHNFRRTITLGILLVCFFISAGQLFAGGQKEKAPKPAAAPKAEQAAPADPVPAEKPAQPAPEKKRAPLAVSAGSVATVNGEAITENAFEAQMANLRNSYRLQKGKDMSPEEETVLKKKVLQAMITKYVLLQKFRELGLSVDPDRVKQEVQKVRDRYPSEEKFTQAMADQGYDLERLKKEITQSLQVFMLQQQVVKDVNVTDEELKRAYNANLDKMTQPETVRARHILIKVPKDATDEQKAAAHAKIEGILKELKAGADFATLAKEKSEGPSNVNGGDLGYFSADKMVPSFSKAAFALQPGEISDIVETQFGYHIIKVEDRKDAWLPTFDQVKDKLRPQLEKQKAQLVFNEYIKKVQGEADIKVLRPDLTDQPAN